MKKNKIGGNIMDNNDFVKEITNIDEDIAKWYTDIVLKAELADYAETKGCIAIRPYGYALWENIQKYTDEKIGDVDLSGIATNAEAIEETNNKLNTHSLFWVNSDHRRFSISIL